jgi:hypothetical protein
MKLKSLLIVVTILAAVSAAVFVARRPAAPVAADIRIGQTLANRTAIEQAAGLRVSDQGKTVSLIRQPDGTWGVASYFDLPADFTKLSSLVASLTEAKLQRLVTTSAGRIARLEFKDTKVELLDATGKPLWSVTLGKNAESGGGRYVRYGNEDKAYLASLNLWLDAESKNWADSQILNLKPDEIAKVEIPFAEGGPITVSRAKKDDAWTADKTPAGQRVKAEKISAVLGAVGTVRFSETVDPTDAGIAVAKANERVFRLTTFAGKTYTVALGRKPEEKKLKPAVAPVSASALPVPATPGPEKNADPTAAEAAIPTSPAQASPAKPAAPEYETIPAGPVFVFVGSSDPAAPINALMQKRAFQISDYTFTGLPQKSDELFEPAPADDKTVEPKKS